MAKQPIELAWIEDFLPDGLWRRKSMFGGFGYYIDDKMILVTFEGTNLKWSGAHFPVEKEFQDLALKQQPQLKPHSILPKWLFLPLQTENFDQIFEDVLKDVLRPNSVWGSYPKPKKKAKKVKETFSLNMVTRYPRLFSDEPAEDVLQKAEQISDLKNLGAETQAAFARAGIKTAPQFIKMGWKKALKKLIGKNPKYRHALFAYALIGALKNIEFSRISEEDKAEARAFTKSLAVVKSKDAAMKTVQSKSRESTHKNVEGPDKRRTKEPTQKKLKKSANKKVKVPVKKSVRKKLTSR